MVSKIYCFMYIIEVMCDFVCRVVNYSKFDFVDSVWRIVLCFVCKMSVCRYREYFYVMRLKFFVFVSNVVKFSWIYKCEICWVKYEYCLFIFDVFVVYVDEFIVFKCCCFERFNSSID